MEPPSDIQGLIYIDFEEDIDEVSMDLAKEMKKSGLPISVEGLLDVS